MTQPRLAPLRKAGSLKRVEMMTTMAVTMINRILMTKTTIMVVVVVVVDELLIRHVAWIRRTENVSIRAFLFAAHLGI